MRLMSFNPEAYKARYHARNVRRQNRAENNEKISKKRLQRLGNMAKVAMGAKERPNVNEIRGKEVEQIAQNQMNILGLQEDQSVMYHPTEKSRFGGLSGRFWCRRKPGTMVTRKESRRNGCTKDVPLRWRSELKIILGRLQMRLIQY
jgi:hypothetical protein